MKARLHPKAWLAVSCGVLGLFQTCQADGLAPGDPAERLPLGVTGVVWLVLLAAALTGLRLIRRSR